MIARKICRLSVCLSVCLGPCGQSVGRAGPAIREASSTDGRATAAEWMDGYRVLRDDHIAQARLAAR